jgi:hypothetical protein
LITNNLNILKQFKMKKQTIFNEEYVAPEFEVISTMVEAGFALSVDISDAEEDNFGEF